MLACLLQKYWYSCPSWQWWWTLQHLFLALISRKIPRLEFRCWIEWLGWNIQPSCVRSSESPHYGWRGSGGDTLHASKGTDCMGEGAGSACNIQLNNTINHIIKSWRGKKGLQVFLIAQWYSMELHCLESAYMAVQYWPWNNSTLQTLLILTDPTTSYQFNNRPLQTWDKYSIMTNIMSMILHIRHWCPL